MIARTAASVLGWYAPRRRRAMDAAARRAGAVQERTLRRLVGTAAATDFGRQHDFRAVRSIQDYQARVPLRDYLAFQPWWTRAIAGEHDVTWPGRPRHWVKTSGTTAGDKLIPVTPEAFASHRRGGWDALVMAVERIGARRLLGGPMLFLGGCTRLTALGDDARAGDLSGLVLRRLPPGLRARYSPGPALSAIPDWETRIDAIARLVARQDLRLLSGMPSWTLILFQRVAEVLGAPDGACGPLGARWPNLGVVVHGGVSFAPYRELFGQWIGRPLEYVEVYPASEGFVGLQTERSGGLTLMVDYDIFYEFVPVEDLGAARPRRHTVDEVVLGLPYAVAMTTPAGLWSYLLGDTVRFVARDPLRLEITGRTRHFVNAFGENVIVEEVERALVEACRRGHAEVVEFTLAPRYPSPAQPRGGHEWLIEFTEPPRAPELFAQVLDETLQRLNTDYRTKRAGDVGMVRPRILELPAGTFYRWMRQRGTLGDQHKIPRVTNDRTIADGLLETVAAQGRQPLIASGPDRRRDALAVNEHFTRGQ
jgi:hypothetical protein